MVGGQKVKGSDRNHLQPLLRTRMRIKEHEWRETSTKLVLVSWRGDGREDYYREFV